MKVLLAVLALGLAGCSDAKPVGPTNATTTKANVNGTFTRIEVDGIPCIVWMNEVGVGSNAVGYGGLDCDWRGARG